MKKIVIACDSFKGSLSSREVAEAFLQGLREVAPHYEAVAPPLADGGEGTAEALVMALDGEFREVEAHDPLGRPIRARFGVVESGQAAVIELAAASGLTLLVPEELDPLKASTYGFGELIRDALKRGVRRLLLGLGGSATVDGGVGMLRALGFRFLDCAGQEVAGGGGCLEQIASIETSHVLPALREVEIRVMCDVRNPLCGAEGAAAVFGPQKGADGPMVERLERGLQHFATVVEHHTGCRIADLEGAGAAGGVGGALTALLGARLERGAELLLDVLHFERLIAGVALVITGEGRIDRQTLMGKLPAEVLRRAQEANIPCIAIGGGVAWCEELRSAGFAEIVCVTPEGMALQEAMQPTAARENIRIAARQILQKWG